MLCVAIVLDKLHIGEKTTQNMLRQQVLKVIYTSQFLAVIHICSQEGGWVYLLSSFIQVILELWLLIQWPFKLVTALNTRGTYLWSSGCRNIPRSCNCDLSLQHLAHGYVSVSDITCQLPTSKANTEAGRKSEIWFTWSPCLMMATERWDLCR